MKPLTTQFNVDRLSGVVTTPTCGGCCCCCCCVASLVSGATLLATDLEIKGTELNKEKKLIRRAKILAYASLPLQLAVMMYALETTSTARSTFLPLTTVVLKGIIAGAVLLYAAYFIINPKTPVWRPIALLILFTVAFIIEFMVAVTIVSRSYNTNEGLFDALILTEIVIAIFLVLIIKKYKRQKIGAISILNNSNKPTDEQPHQPIN